jgi:hypothetical protein
MRRCRTFSHCPDSVSPVSNGAAPRISTEGRQRLSIPRGHQGHRRNAVGIDRGAWMVGRVWGGRPETGLRNLASLSFPATAACDGRNARKSARPGMTCDARTSASGTRLRRAMKLEGHSAPSLRAGRCSIAPDAAREENAGKEYPRNTSNPGLASGQTDLSPRTRRRRARPPCDRRSWNSSDRRSPLVRTESRFFNVKARSLEQ